MDGVTALLTDELLHMTSLQVGSATSLLQFALLPIAKVLVLCGFGLSMATPYINILTAPSRRVLSKLVFSLFLPCLIFTQLGTAISFQKIFLWWFIPVNIVIGAVLGCTLGYLMALLVRPPPQFFNFFVIMVGIGNIGNIPLVIIGAICRPDDNPFGQDSETCNSEGVAYISFGQWVGAVIVYTFVFHVLAPPKDANRESSAEIDIKVESISPDHIDDANGFSQTNFLPDNIQKEDSISAPLLLPQSSDTLPKVSGRWLENIFQPPVVASLLALVMGSVPVLRNLMFEEHSIFFFFYDSLNMVGGAMVPCIMLVLGGNLVGGPGSSQLGLRSTIAITITRLFLMPPIGLAVVLMADRLGFLPPNNKMFQFVLLLQQSMPTSILAGKIYTHASIYLFLCYLFNLCSELG
jgi:predicted permease